MKSFQVIHTITSPYRIHMFNIMDEILKSRGVEFHVHFMSNNTAHRPNDWSNSSQKIYFNHSFWPDVGPNLYGRRVLAQVIGQVLTSISKLSSSKRLPPTDFMVATYY